jgi:hypothetical protein
MALCVMCHVSSLRGGVPLGDGEGPAVWGPRTPGLVALNGPLASWVATTTTCRFSQIRSDAK